MENNLINYEESDQAGVIGDVMYLHLLKHPKGKPDPSCQWCKAFIISDAKSGEPLMSHKCIILDFNSNEKINL